MQWPVVPGYGWVFRSETARDVGWAAVHKGPGLARQHVQAHGRIRRPGPASCASTRGPPAVGSPFGGRCPWFRRRPRVGPDSIVVARAGAITRSTVRHRVRLRTGPWRPPLVADALAADEPGLLAAYERSCRTSTASTTGARPSSVCSHGRPDEDCVNTVLQPLADGVALEDHGNYLRHDELGRPRSCTRRRRTGCRVPEARNPGPEQPPRRSGGGLDRTLDVFGEWASDTNAIS